MFDSEIIFHIFFAFEILFLHTKKYNTILTFNFDWILSFTPNIIDLLRHDKNTKKTTNMFLYSQEAPIKKQKKNRNTAIQDKTAIYHEHSEPPVFA